MLKTYEALYENGQFKWLDEKPPIIRGRGIVTVLEDDSEKRRKFPIPEAGTVEILGDIISPIVDEADWEC
jgi:hypothetical protein